MGSLIAFVGDRIELPFLSHADIFLPKITTQTYLVDAFPEQAASALAANSLLRSVAGGLIPLSGLSLNNSLGLGWSTTLFGFLALAFGVPPAMFYWHGEALRRRFAVSLS